MRACAPTADDYPLAALRAEVTGTTRIRFEVNEQGKLERARVVRSAGPSREHQLLDRVALDKLSGCTFRAGTDEAGRPVGGSFEVDYVWRLDP